MPEEEIYLFDFGDGRLYNCGTGERVVRHEYKIPGTYLTKAWSDNPRTMSDTVPIPILGTNPTPDPEPPADGIIVRFLKWLLHLFGG
jgi:hypothetical protein